jgi:pimeloyl-ACP methyl ester carboxylesterase
LGGLDEFTNIRSSFEQQEEVVLPVEDYIPVDEGVGLFYYAQGNGPNKVIIPCAHGLMDDLIEPLTCGCQLIFYDQRGRGRSDPDPDASRTWRDYEVRDLESIRQHLGFEHFALLGWSYMGGISALYAAQHTARVQQLILMCPVAPRNPAPYHDPDARAAKAASRLDPTKVEQLKVRQAAGDDLENPVAYCRENIQVYYPSKMGRPEALVRMRSDPCVFPNEWAHNLSLHWQTHFPPDSLEHDWRTEVGSVTAQTLVIHGLEDLIPLEAAREWAYSIPQARLWCIPGVGHFPHLEAPEVFFPAINHFLAGEWPEEAEIVQTLLSK